MKIEIKYNSVRLSYQIENEIFSPTADLRGREANKKVVKSQVAWIALFKLKLMLRKVNSAAL